MWLERQAGVDQEADLGVVLLYLVGHHKIPQTEWFERQKFIVSELWGHKSKIKVLAGLAPSEGCEGESVPSLSPNFWWSAAVSGILCLVDPSPRSLPLSSHCVLLLVRLPSDAPFCKDTSHTELAPTLRTLF